MYYEYICNIFVCFFFSQVLFPLTFSKLLKKVDIEAHVIKYSGEIAVAGGVRYGISHCLSHLVSDEMKEKMRLGKIFQKKKIYIHRYTNVVE